MNIQYLRQIDINHVTVKAAPSGRAVHDARAMPATLSPATDNPFAERNAVR